MHMFAGSINMQTPANSTVYIAIIFCFNRVDVRGLGRDTERRNNSLFLPHLGCCGLRRPCCTNTVQSKANAGSGGEKKTQN